jgi:ketosteroid isomerase-like protein
VLVLASRLECRLLSAALSPTVMNRREAVLAGLASLAATVTAAPPAKAQTSEPDTENPELEPLRALLKAHDVAFSNQDFDGVMATLSEKAAIMGNGPGEIWSGPEEIKAAYQRFFEGFDKGQQNFDYEFNLGQVGADFGWLLTSGNVSGAKDGKEFTFPVNISLSATKDGDKWLIASLHFSTLTDDTTEEEEK